MLLSFTFSFLSFIVTIWHTTRTFTITSYRHKEPEHLSQNFVLAVRHAQTWSDNLPYKFLIPVFRFYSIPVTCTYHLLCLLKNTFFELEALPCLLLSLRVCLANKGQFSFDTVFTIQITLFTLHHCWSVQIICIGK